MSEIDTEIQPRTRKPEWLKVKIPIGENYKKVRNKKNTKPIFVG